MSDDYSETGPNPEEQLEEVPKSVSELTRRIVDKALEYFDYIADYMKANLNTREDAIAEYLALVRAEVAGRAVLEGLGINHIDELKEIAESSTERTLQNAGSKLPDEEASEDVDRTPA